MGKIERKSPEGSKSSEKSQGNKKRTPRQGSTEAIDPRNITSFREDQKDWSWDNLPAILYQFKPTKEEEKKEREPPKMKVLGGKRVKDIEILPDHISSDVEEFRVEAWMRLDRRIQLQDIIDRMHEDFAIERNALQQRNVRFRKAFNLIAWSSGNKISSQLEQDVLQRMIDHGIDPTLNSTRGLTPGLINPELGEEGGRIALPDNYGPEKRGHRGPRTPKKKRDAAKIEEDVDMTDALDPTTPVGESAPLTPPPTMPAPSAKTGSFFGQRAASEESLATVFSPLIPGSPVECSPVPHSSIEPLPSSSVPGSPVVSFTVAEKDDLDSSLDGSLYDGDQCPTCNLDFLLKKEPRQEFDWLSPCEEELSGLDKDVPKVLKARHPSQMKRKHKAFKKALPFCNTDSLYDKFVSKFDLDDMISVVPISRTTAPPSPVRVSPSFISEPLKRRLIFKPHPTKMDMMNAAYNVTLNEYYAGERFLFEMPYVEGVI